MTQFLFLSLFIRVVDYDEESTMEALSLSFLPLRSMSSRLPRVEHERLAEAGRDKAACCGDEGGVAMPADS